MIEAREDVLAFSHLPQPHWKKSGSTNLLERVNEEIKFRTRVVGILPNNAAIIRLVDAVLRSSSRIDSWKAPAFFPPKASLPSQNWRICRPCSAQPPEKCNTQAPCGRDGRDPIEHSGNEWRSGPDAVNPGKHGSIPLASHP